MDKSTNRKGSFKSHEIKNVLSAFKKCRRGTLYGKSSLFTASCPLFGCDLRSQIAMSQALLQLVFHSWQDKREAVGLAALKLLLGLSHDVAASRFSELLQ